MSGVNSVFASISAKIMVITMIVLLFVIAFCSFLSLCAKWYWSRTDNRTSRHGIPTPVSTRPRGLDRAILKSLPVMVYDPKEFKEGLECSVCLNETLNGEKVRLLPNCNHGFHLECIDMWFKSHSTCPLCRNFVISSQKKSSSSNQEMQELDVARALSDSDSGLDSNTGSESDDNDHEDASIVHSRETLAFPTNVLFWGNEVQVRSLGEATNVVTSSLSSFSRNIGVGRQRGELVIEIPRDLSDDCLSSSTSTTLFSEEEEKTPVASSRLRSLKRLLSRGARVAPWTNGSSSSEIEPV